MTAAILWHCTQHGHSIGCGPSLGMAVLIGFGFTFAFLAWLNIVVLRSRLGK